jgi:hypothetical protein
MAEPSKLRKEFEELKVQVNQMQQVLVQLANLLHALKDAK